jgi:hypothetical protein
MTTALNRIANLRVIVDAEAQGLLGSHRQRYRGAYQQVAALAHVNEEYVYQLYTGKKPKMGDDVAAKIEHAFGSGRPPGWLDLPPRHTVVADADASVAPVRPPTTDEAVETLAELLLGLDDDGREMASTALSRFARNPMNAKRFAETLDTLAKIHPREPDPEPPLPSRRRVASTAAKSNAKAQLSVKVGGGKKVQMALPFKTVADPWDSAQAPANERAWYAKVKSAPKAKN